jgi:hypothetical protein
MDDEKWPSLSQDPSWVLEQIEMGVRQLREAGVELPRPPEMPKLPSDEIQSTVTKLLEEELARLEEKPVPRKR